MHSVLIFFFIVLFLTFFLAIALTCYRTYRVVMERRRNLRLRRYANENRGKIGLAQNWQCYECRAVMLSDFHIMIDGQGLVALCAICSSTKCEKYSHIYGDDDESKDSMV